MKIEITDDQLSYLVELLKGAASQSPKEMAKRFKYLARRLEPPKVDIRLSTKNLTFLFSFMDAALKILSLKDDPLSKAEAQVLGEILKKVEDLR